MAGKSPPPRRQMESKEKGCPPRVQLCFLVAMGMGVIGYTSALFVSDMAEDPSANDDATLASQMPTREAMLKRVAALKGTDYRAPLKQPVINVRDLGCVPNGMDCTEFFKLAIKKINATKGGTLLVPFGRWKTSPLELVSGLTLFLEAGAALLASTNFSRYRVVEPIVSYGFGREGSKRGRREAFLHGTGLKNVSITGKGGTIDGGGSPWWEAKRNLATWDGITLPHLVEFQFSEGVEISGLTLQNSPMWTIHPFACKDVLVKDIVIINPHDVKNTDGINPDSCENVLIDRVVYYGGDDGIAIKSGWDCFGDERGFNRPTRNVVIRNFTVRRTTAAAVAIGSEMSGGVSDILIENLDAREVGAGGAVIIKTTAARGGYVRNMRVRGLQMGNVQGNPGQIGGLMIVGQLGSWVPEANPACKGQPAKQLPDIANIFFEDVHQRRNTFVFGPAMVFQGLAQGQILRNLHLTRVNIQSFQMPECSNANIVSDKVQFKSHVTHTNWAMGDRCTIRDASDEQSSGWLSWASLR
eukprot:TRINITY_DN12167_c0_g2_i1.p1 TRINITY_DN12167_c0_g2~~TRINITY_DN12167_c0_g2_i1.p1  ORF type:complete len:527 (-),score=112.13 TRINITY_DN12167_c0_g2_i1:709-2289(-)